MDAGPSFNEQVHVLSFLRFPSVKNNKHRSSSCFGEDAIFELMRSLFFFLMLILVGKQCCRALQPIEMGCGIRINGAFPLELLGVLSQAMI